MRPTGYARNAAPGVKKASTSSIATSVGGCTRGTGTFDDENTKFKVECFFDLGDPKDAVRIERLDKGEAITVRGEYDGRVSNVQLREYLLVK